MKTIFIPARIKYKLDHSKIKNLGKDLPSDIAITYSIQYIDMAKEIRDILKADHTITLFRQVLGCSKPAFPKNTKAILLVSNGRFHAISLAYESKIPVYVYDNGNFLRIADEEVRAYETREKGAFLKFLHAETLGILVSSKPGQENLKDAIKLRKDMKDKKSYLFISNSINVGEFENFGLDAWVNTACPRMDMNDSNIMNIAKLKEKMDFK